MQGCRAVVFEFESVVTLTRQLPQLLLFIETWRAAVGVSSSPINRAD